MHWHLEVLPPAQRRLWDELGATPPSFTLYGGTALALRLGHRTSVDFDFFTNEVFDHAHLLQHTPYLKSLQITKQTAQSLQGYVGTDQPVSISFFGGLELKELQPADTQDTPVPIASVVDIAATKLKTILSRAEQKDYIDIAAILATGLTLIDCLGAVQTKYPYPISPLTIAQALTSFVDGNLAGLDARIKNQLVLAVQTLPLENLEAAVADAASRY